MRGFWHIAPGLPGAAPPGKPGGSYQKPFAHPGDERGPTGVLQSLSVQVESNRCKSRLA